MADQVLTCVDCRHEFVFTEGEQQYFADRQLTPPKRCKPCREARKADRSRPHEPGREARRRRWSD